MKVAQRRRIAYGDDRHCHGCGNRCRRVVIEVPGVGPVQIVTCPRCDGDGCVQEEAS